MAQNKRKQQDSPSQGSDKYFMDIDRMVSEGLGGGQVTEDNGLISETTTDTMDEPESVIENEKYTDAKAANKNEKNEKKK